MVTFRVSAWILTVCFFFALFAGCAPETKDIGEIKVVPEKSKVVEPVVKADIAFKFAPGQAGTYRYVSEMIQDFKFEQPSLEKIKEDQTRSLVDITFDQKIETVNDDGSALAGITIGQVRMFMQGKGGVNLDFDSTRDEDKGKPLYAIIGKSYTVSLLPDGSAKAVNTKEVIAAVTGKTEKRIVTGLLKDAEIMKRHGIPGLPDPAQSQKATGQIWSKVVAGHEKLIPPKAFEKTYKVSNIDGKIVTVEMDGVETDKPVEGLGSKSGMGFLGAIFDTTESYKGKMTFDAADRRVVGYDEKLFAEYIATDADMGGAKDKEPDVLRMALTYSISLESIEK